MQKLLDRLRTLFLVLFALGAAASWGWHLFYVLPKRECLSRGAWWHAQKRTCATPIDITEITGRPRTPPPAAEAPASNAPRQP